MKKFILTFLVVFLFLMPGVKAETYTYDFAYQDFVSSDFFFDYKGKYVYNNFNAFISDNRNREIFEDVYKPLINYYNENYKNNYPYFYTSVTILSKTSDVFTLDSVMVSLHCSEDSNFQSAVFLYSSYYDGTYYTPSSNNGVGPFLSISLGPNGYFPSGLFESNFNYIINSNSTSYYIYNIYYDSTLTSTYESGDSYPVLFSEGYENSIFSNYTTINLDDYHYVILSLKDYNQEKAFSTNLQVKGMVGITPVYNYGTLEKETITDRCNLSYQDYTDYRMYILENDLKNNSVYIVKSCEINSSFKFDNTIFDITYVTDENKSDPVVTINGKDYHTIPFDKLSNSANKNEENNYVPGENNPFDPFGSVADYISGFWSALTTFMGLVTKFFNTLPVEIRAISITSFVTAVTLGLIKILKS